MRLGKVWLLSLGFTALLATVAVEAEQDSAALVGRWEGMYIPKAAKGEKGATRSRELGQTGKITKMLVTVNIAPGDGGKLSGTWTTQTQQTPTPMEIATEGDTIRFTWKGFGGNDASWEGKLSGDGSKLDGKWEGKGFGGAQSAPLVLKRSGG